MALPGRPPPARAATPSTSSSPAKTGTAMRRAGRGSMKWPTRFQIVWATA